MQARSHTAHKCTSTSPTSSSAWDPRCAPRRACASASTRRLGEEDGGHWPAGRAAGRWLHWHRAGRDLHRAHVVRITSTLRSLSRCTRSLSRCSRSGLGRNALRLATGSCRSEVHVAGHERGSALERRQRCGSSCSWHARLAICQARIRRARYARYARYRCTPLDAARAGLSPHLRVAHRASHNAQGRGGG